nr:PREDICTED: protein SLX4IP isoform X2 [Latimeria chalumnae]|eukprot:XP_014352757.1 PREDICTED: protein SLX4IP isoform X2 [Latimeria chalumnae]
MRMPANKFVVKEVSLLLKDTIDTRIKQYLEARRQHGQTKQNKEFTQANPRCMKGENFHLAAYFIKRHVNLKCIVKQRGQELRVFPDRFVVCLNPCKAEPPNNTELKKALETPAEGGTSQYFAGYQKGNLNVSVNTQKKREALTSIVKKLKPKAIKSTLLEDYQEDFIKESLGSVLLGKQNMKGANGTASEPTRTEDRRAGQADNYINTAQSSTQLPLLELENDTGERQPDEVNNRQQLHPPEQLKIGLLSSDPAYSSESALPDPSQSQGVSKAQRKRRGHYFQEEVDNKAKRVIFEEALVTPSEFIMEADSADSLRQASTKRLPLESKLCSKQESVKTTSEEVLLTSGKLPLGPLFMKNNIEQANQNKPTTNIEESSLVSKCSFLKIDCRPSEKKKGEENVPRKLKLQRLKKS